MDSLTIAFSLAWVAVGLFLGRMALRNAQLTRRLEDLRRQRAEDEQHTPYSRAA